MDHPPGPDSKRRISRREFLTASGLAGGGLVIGVYLAARGGGSPDSPSTTQSPPGNDGTDADPTGSSVPEALFEPSVFLTIASDNTVTITVHKSEMGQGVRTSLPMIVAEELEADWKTLVVEQGGLDRRLGDQVTGGSTSIAENYARLRRAGAAAREMLLAAAAQVWQVETGSCFAEKGTVVHRSSGRTLTYGELAATAATFDVPSAKNTPLKEPADFKLIGTRTPRLDQPQILDGTAVFGLDVRLPGMLYAVVARPPFLGGTLDSYDEAAARSVTGVSQVTEIESGVAVIADSTWAALRGREALAARWNASSDAGHSTSGIRKALIARADADAAAAVADDAQTLHAIYEVPYLAHATMEPMNCVADVGPSHCDLWAPTQSPQAAVRAARELTQLPEAAVQVHVPLLGGGFGRRFEPDFVAEAVQISQAAGAPVQVFWTREDDIQNDFYHPFTYHLATARLDQPALPEVKSYSAPAGPATGSWRSVTNIPDAYVRESFVDELAVALGVDPYDMRKTLEPERLHGVLEVAARESGWGGPLPTGRGRGMACHSCWDATPVAIVVELSVAGDAGCRVHRVVCAVDCGVVVNPGMVEAQMEGGVVFGLTAALKGTGITFEDGRVQQSNFHDYPLLRFDEVPDIEVHIVSSSNDPSGVGEMSTPPVIPAVANAVFAATGKRVRHLPIQPEDLV